MYKMKKLSLRVIIIFSGLMLFTSSWASQKVNDNIDIGIKYRIMYNNSDLKSQQQYDFFRQRLRFGMDIHKNHTGGYIQLEYRGGWGGSSPAVDDPRKAYAVNPFNRLKARGIRYGYLHADYDSGRLIAGIIPLDDQVDQMLFSSYWDLNVGGVAWNGLTGHTNYRLSYVRLVDGAALRNDESVRDVNEHFLIGDWNVKFQDCDFGVHYYGIYGKIFDNAVVDLDHSWIGIHGNVHWLGLLWHGVILYQNGDTKYAAQTKRHSDGWLYRLEAKWEEKDKTFQVLGIHSTGGRDGSGFQTLHHIIHTQGYWAYTHSFTYDGPSGVNEYALEPGNLGYGLNSIQAKFQWALPHNIHLTTSAAWYYANVAMPTFTKQPSKKIGSEIAAILTFHLSDNLALDAGGALTFLGEAGKKMYQGNDMNHVNELFSRLQFVF